MGCPGPTSTAAIEEQDVGAAVAEEAGVEEVELGVIVDVALLVEAVLLMEIVLLVEEVWVEVWEVEVEEVCVVEMVVVLYFERDAGEAWASPRREKLRAKMLIFMMWLKAVLKGSLW
jgi:hypothetical protein